MSSLSHYDICIIGSGPAGLTLCNELSSSNKKICIIECGGLEKNKNNDELRKTVSQGEIKIKDSSRERIFGGTSTTWSGLSAPLDKIDLENWPIDYQEMITYYKRASHYGFPEYKEFDLSTFDMLKEKTDFIIKSDKLEEKIFIAKDPPWNFGKKLKNIFTKQNIDLYTNLTVKNLISKKDHKGKITITKISAIDPKGQEQNISANIFVIATGGIESVRLLLLSQDTCPQGLGNEFDQVGRYIMNHPKNTFGIIKLKKPITNLDYLFGYLHTGWAKYAGFHFKSDFQKSNKLLNSYIRLEPIFPWTDRQGITQFILIVKKFKYFLTWWKKRQKQIVNLRDWNETGDDENSENKFTWLSSISKIIKDIPAVLSYTNHRLFKNKKVLIHSIRIRNFMEMEPRSENRIILDDKTDRYGNKIPKIILNTSDLDKKTLIKLHQVFNQALIENNIGQLKSNLENSNPWPINTEASHHLGGTIMGNEEKTSVVDKNLKLHSVQNLYICSGSVFPSSSCVNPTYTICALAIRLADKLKQLR